MALSTEDKRRVLYCLGYPLVQPYPSIGLGVPGAVGTIWILERAMELLQESDGGYERVRKILGIMDGIEELLVAAQERRAVTAADTLHLNREEPDQLEREYQRWGRRLADIFGCTPYMNSERYSRGWGKSGGLRTRVVVG